MKKIWYLISILIISALLINVISADTQTYYEGYTINNPLLMYSTANYDNYVYADENVRFIFIERNNNFYPYFVSLTSSKHAYTKQSNVNTWTSISVSSTNYYLNNTNIPFRTKSGSSISLASITNINVNYLTYIGPTENYNDLDDFAYYYTFGDGANDVQPNYGELIINYAQDIRTTGNGSDNMDLITWNAFRDTAGNNLQGKNIEIQAIAGYFEGSSYADLKTSLFSDWQASTHPAVTMYKGDIEQSHQEYTWEEVAYNFRSLNTLGTWFWNIFADNDTWYQYGWRYQARLLDENLEPLTEWQTLYTGNSYTPSATETFTDDEPLTPDDVETINDINEQNGTTNNWYINNTVINNNEYNQTWQQNIIENIYNILQGTPDPIEQQHATDVQNTIDNAIDQEDNYVNDLKTQLHDLQLPDISENNGLINALRWVREVHHKTIEETELGTVVLVTMIIGLVTYLIGRRNG